MSSHRRVVVVVPSYRDARPSYFNEVIAHCEKQDDSALFLLNDSGRTWIAVAQLVAVYIDYGVTEEMHELIEYARKNHVRIELRELDA